jgi:hypothetical protein
MTLCDWPDPRTEDDGVSNVAEVIVGLHPTDGDGSTSDCRWFGLMGCMMGHETTIRVPLAAIDCIRDILRTDGGIDCEDWCVSYK